jgi:hypothetical protein
MVVFACITQLLFSQGTLRADSTNREDLAKAALSEMEQKHDLRVFSSQPYQFTKEDLPVFASLLPTAQGFYAFHAMCKIDQKESIPLFCKYLSTAEENPRRDICNLFIEKCDEPYFPREMAREAVLRTLEQAHKVYKLMMALGALGRKEDIPAIFTAQRRAAEIIAQKWGKFGDTEIDSLTKAVRWSTARLGDEESLAQMIQLMTPPNSEPPFAKDITAWKCFYEELGQASYVRHPKLVPTLISNLHLRQGGRLGECLVYFSPSWHAVEALRRTVPLDRQPTASNKEDAWLTWWETEGKKWLEEIETTSKGDSSTE